MCVHVCVCVCVYIYIYIYIYYIHLSVLNAEGYRTGSFSNYIYLPFKLALLFLVKLNFTFPVDGIVVCSVEKCFPNQ